MSILLKIECASGAHILVPKFATRHCHHSFCITECATVAFLVSRFADSASVAHRFADSATVNHQFLVPFFATALVLRRLNRWRYCSLLFRHCGCSSAVCHEALVFRADSVFCRNLAALVFWVCAVSSEKSNEATSSIRTQPTQQRTHKCAVGTISLPNRFFIPFVF